MKISLNRQNLLFYKKKAIYIHVTALFGILLLISLRVFGLIIALELLHDLKELKFKTMIFGWLFWILSGCSALISGYSENQLVSDIFLLINGVTTSIALLFLMMGLVSYFREISGKALVILSIIFILVQLIAFLLGFDSIAFNLSSIILFLIVIVYSLIPIRKIDVFKNELSIKSYYWYLILISSFISLNISYLIFVFQGYSFDFYSDEFSVPMFISYLLNNIITIVIIIYSIHLEYDISKNQKFKLKDNYSHDLGNLIQVIYSATDLTYVNDDLNNEKADNLDLIQKKCEEAAQLIKDIKEIQ